MTPLLFVTPRPDTDHVAETWNPWRALRDREHLRLGFHSAARHLGGGLYQRCSDGRAVVILDPALPRRERNAALAHELVHDERGGIPDGAPQHLVAKEEAAVDRIVTRRLVPPDQLAEFVTRRLTVGPVTAADIADEFDVPHQIAADASEHTPGAPWEHHRP